MYFKTASTLMSDQLSFRRMSYISSGGVNSPEISQDYNGNHE